MEKHRVRKAKCIDGTGKDHIFIEFKRNIWYEVNCIPTHDDIEIYIYNDNKENASVVGYTSCAFRVGTIKDWKELPPICSNPVITEQFHVEIRHYNIFITSVGSRQNNNCEL